MARPTKTNLSYFSHDCHLDEKIEYLESLYGLAGYAIYFKLLERIYGGDGYYLKLEKMTLPLFAKRINGELTLVSGVITTAVEVGLFSKRHFNEGFLTSIGIQKRFLAGASKRASVFFHPDLILVSRSEFKNLKLSGVSGELIPVSGEETPEKVPKSTQSKVKESKGKESRVEESNELPPPPDDVPPWKLILKKILTTSQLEKERWQMNYGINGELEEEAKKFSLWFIRNEYRELTEQDLRRSAKKASPSHVRSSFESAFLSKFKKDPGPTRSKKPSHKRLN